MFFFVRWYERDVCRYSLSSFHACHVVTVAACLLWQYDHGHPDHTHTRARINDRPSFCAWLTVVKTVLSVDGRSLIGRVSSPVLPRRANQLMESIFNDVLRLDTFLVRLWSTLKRS